MNQIKPINNPLDRQGRNDFNHNFGVLDKRTKATNQTIETLVVESGTSDAETILARNGEKSLKARLDKTDAYIDRQDEQILLQAQRYADTLGLDGNVSVDDLESIVFKDDYKAEWEKNLRDYEALKVGNENLLLNTKDFSENWYVVLKTEYLLNQTWVVKGYDFQTYQKLEDVVAGEEYTFSVDIFRTEQHKGRLRVNINEFNKEGDTVSSRIFYSNSNLEFNKIHRFQGSLKLHEETDRLILYILEANIKIGDVDDKTILISQPKFEKGGKATDWTPNPKDIKASLFLIQLATDMYQANTGSWNKAERDYELLKVGKTNLLPEVGEQIRAGIVPLEHSNSVGPYTGRIENVVSNGKQYFFDIKEPVKKGETFSLKASFSNNESNAYVIYLYDENKELIFESKGNIEQEIEWNAMPNIRGNTTYKGIISDGFKNGEQMIFTIIGDRVKYISVGVGMYSSILSTQTLTVSNWKLERSNTSTPFTPSPESLNASPFTVKLAQDYYNQQEEINELRNAILTLGGK